MGRPVGLGQGRTAHCVLLGCYKIHGKAIHTTTPLLYRPVTMSVGEGERERVSQLCKPLWECLNAPDSSHPLSVLEYFIQFMAARDALHLLQFWFSVASLRNAASSSHTDSQSHTHPHRADVSPTVTAAHVAVGEGNSGSVRDRENTCRDREKSPVCVLESGVADDGGTLLNKRSVVGDGVRGDGVRGDGVSVNGAVREGRVEGGAPGTIEPYIARQTSLNLVSDAMGIYSTYIALNALTSVHVPDDIRQSVEVNICPEDGIVDRNCFNKAQQFVYEIIDKRYYQEFLRSSSLCKYQLELVSSGQLSLLDFLLGGDSLGYFMEFMEAEGALPLLQFWLTAESFITQVTAATSSGQQSISEQHLQDAISIYERYFSLQASEPLGMGDGVRVEVESRICDDRGPRADSYLPPQLIAYDIMTERFYPHFLESGPYLKFLDGLLALVKSTPEDLHTSSKPDTANTVETESKTFTCFPACDVDDPDSLWRRPTLVMRLGCVDGMGQYCSEIDPFPTKSARAKDQGRHFRRFKNRQEEEEWEYAVKVSRNIMGKVLKRTLRKSLRK